MPDITVHQLAAKLRVDPVEVLRLLRKLGMPEPSVTSPVSPVQQRAVRDRLSRSGASPSPNPFARPRVSKTSLGETPPEDPDLEHIRRVLGAPTQTPPPTSKSSLRVKRAQAESRREAQKEREHRLSQDLEWAQRDFDRDEREAWEEAGLGRHQAAVADQARRAGIRLSDLTEKLGGRRVGKMLREGVSPGQVAARLIAQRDQAA